ncbi:hypothetical protein HYG81_01445 [Natrinema zhouii]|uniref:Uncharacterized protein n=1 Tax=Natrinema zhouii TaxID=1710539 RepID=A0A7D6CNY5_9EURY|nr:hypothetical protein [Natrinema zhouii]QLK26317.1 hypothetical protein HYG81_01445 [Natrinema zhouii]
MTHTDWRPDPELDKKRDREVWTHTAPHHINDGEIDGDISFSDEVLEPFVDDEDTDGDE